MKIMREFIDGDGFKVPCVTITPQDPKGAVVVVHGYGGTKEKTLGLAWRIAEKGFITGCIDLRGHGEHQLDLDDDVLLDIETAISRFKNYGEVTAVGHSFGGRFALISSADYAIGISPALGKNFSNEVQNNIRESMDYLVHKSSNNSLFDILNDDMDLLEFDLDKLLLIYGTRDLSEIILECEDLKSKNLDVIKIDEALHSDIFLLELTFKAITDKLQKWYLK
ncbi:alpha/beta fold hydrolase [Methanobacterium sp.]|uniref:alpha/beta hydrolase n=1 Tax=Methanobacterium sp. TaxID=2164 RepID=UPI003158AA91